MSLFIVVGSSWSSKFFLHFCRPNTRALCKKINWLGLRPRFARNNKPFAIFFVCIFYKIKTLFSTLPKTISLSLTKALAGALLLLNTSMHSDHVFALIKSHKKNVFDSFSFVFCKIKTLFSTQLKAFPPSLTQALAGAQLLLNTSIHLEHV